MSAADDPAVDAPDFVVRLARPDEYDEAGRICAAGYHADNFLTFADGSIDRHYEACCSTPRGGRGRASCWWRCTATGGSPARSPGARRAPRGGSGPPARTGGVPDALGGRGRTWSRCRARAGPGLPDRARAAGMTEVLLASLPVMTGAQRIYRRFGFERAPTSTSSRTPQVWLWGFRLNLAVPGPAR